MDAGDLRQTLTAIDGRGYKSYRRIKGGYEFPGYRLYIDHVQSDPFARPSRLRVRIGQELAGLDGELFDNKVRRVALEDYLARAFAAAVKAHVRGKRGTGKSGFVGVDSGVQEVLERTAAVVNQHWVEMRFVVGLPADGRRCRAADAIGIFFHELPLVVEASLGASTRDLDAMRRHVDCVEDQAWLRRRLDSLGLVAFLADGSLLPRRSGVSDRPLETGDIVTLEAPEELRIEVEFPHRGRVEGMGIPAGVTLIVGGGYHGKSTLLKAIERGVYDHIPGDGRETVVTRGDAVKIRAEDGRRVEKVDISPFIDNLPFGVGTKSFSTENASGSTSMAANIIEALEAGSRLLVLDEDTSATNFMIRDEMMQRLIAREREPITPFVDQVRALFDELGVSTLLVMGGSGDYFEVADTIIAMEEYRPKVVTEAARRIVAARRDVRVRGAAGDFDPDGRRVPLPASINPRRGRREKVAARGTGQLAFGRDIVELGSVEQLVDPSQVRAIGDLVRFGLRQGCLDGESSLGEILDCLLAYVAQWGLDIISPFADHEDVPGTEITEADDSITGRGSGDDHPHPGDYALPRRYEVAATINRMRSLRIDWK